MILTRQQAIAEHRKMWRWIAELIEKVKRCVDIVDAKAEYLSEKKYKTSLKNECFLCEYGFQFDDEFCKYCPVKFPEEEPDECFGGLYHKVIYAETWQEQAALARQIAELPEREDV